MRQLLRELGARLTAMQRSLDIRMSKGISAGVAAVCKHADERFQRIEAKIDAMGRSWAVDGTAALRDGAPSMGVQRATGEQAAPRERDVGSAAWPLKEGGAVGVVAQKGAQQVEADVGAARKRIKERLKEALTAKEADSDQGRWSLLEYVFGFSKPDRRIGKAGSRCAVQVSNRPFLAHFCSDMGPNVIPSSPMAGSSIPSPCSCKVVLS